MVQNHVRSRSFPQPLRPTLFQAPETPAVAYPIQSVTIDWDRLRAKRPLVLDTILQDRVQSYLYAGHFRKDERLFPMARQTMNRHIHALVERAGSAPFCTSTRTFRHSFAIHLLLHGRPLKYVSKPLGHKSIDSTEIYTNVLTIDGVHFLQGVDFH